MLLCRLLDHLPDRFWAARDGSEEADLATLAALGDSDRVPDFPLDPTEVPALLYLFLLERYGIRISAVREQVSADLADADDLKYLDLIAPAAVLRIEDVSYDQSGEATIYATHRAVTTNHRYVNEVR
jgi:GntR family transcriptional regulator